MGKVALVAMLAVGCAASSETPDQRVARARREWTQTTNARLKALKVEFPASRVFLRAYKQERELELWVGNADGPLKLYRTYAIAAASGELGPKRKEGDRQVPEGIYRVDRLNPASQFYLSIDLNYPNAYDREVGAARPGGDIFIHGDAKSIGCLAMTDPKIREIYPLVADAWRAGKNPVSCHIFPFRMTAANLAAAAKSQPKWAAFWRQLQPVEAAFNRSFLVPRVKVTRDGYALVKD